MEEQHYVREVRSGQVTTRLLVTSFLSESNRLPSSYTIPQYHYSFVLPQSPEVL